MNIKGNFSNNRFKSSHVSTFLIIPVLLLTLLLLLPGTGEAKKVRNADHSSGYLETALKAAQWLDDTAIQKPFGTVWPALREKPESVIYNLYAGMPGVVLFYLELYYYTGEKRFLETAAKGADSLLKRLKRNAEKPDKILFSLYVGIGGIGFVLEETFKATKVQKYRDGVSLCLELLRKHAIKRGNGIEWNHYTDIIMGSTGTGLFLLYMAERTGNPELTKMGEKVGVRLIELGIAEKGGMKWRLTSKTDYKRFLPNFSHGTAGIAYYLATLYMKSGKKKFLDAALAGAKYLLAVANMENDSCLIFHVEPKGKDRYYLGWCHGPPGTARLFYRLFEATKEKRWLNLMKKSANGIMTSGIPAKRTPGFWNNVGRCCGSAGIADFLIQMQRLNRTNADSGNKNGKQKNQYLNLARRLLDDTIKRGTTVSSGLKWIHAENRVDPESLTAQTGLMQGAAGIGLALLRMAAFEKGKGLKIVFPDSPY